MKPLKIFISYAHEDQNIALAVHNMLQETFGAGLGEAFIDKDGIAVGGNINVSIMEAIKRVDTMIVVSTGVGRTSHEWTGWELGAFQASHTPEGDVLGKAITLCLNNTNPGPLQLMRYVPLDIEPNLLEASESEFVAQYEVTDDDEFVTMLGQFLFAIEGKVLADYQNILGTYRRKVKELKKEIFLALKKRIRDVVKPQKQLIIRYDSSQFNPDIPDIPMNAIITEVGSAFSLFGITTGDTVWLQKTGKLASLVGAAQGRSISWADFKELVSGNPLGQFWCNALANVVHDPNRDNSQVICTGELDHPHRWRVILTTKTIYYNHEVEASLYLVEALQPAYYGDEQTTKLLKGLLIVCRFRFLFLEDKSEFSYFNVLNDELAKLRAECGKLITELDNLRSEALNADLHRPGTWREYVSEEVLQKMMDVWRPIDAALRRLCGEILKPGVTSQELDSIKGSLVDQLKKINTDVKELNSTLLGSMALKLKEISKC